MEDCLIEVALEKASELGATYADLRYEENEYESISVKNEKLEGVKRSKSDGFGVRVIVDGSFGFSSSNDTSKEGILKVTDEACRIAKASAKVKEHSVKLASVKPYKDKVGHNAKIDPFSISLNEKLDLLKEATNSLNVSPEIVLRRGNMRFLKQKKIFASSEGAHIEQDRIESGAGISATAIEGNEVQVRSYPNSFGGDLSTFGYEFIKGLKLGENAKRIGEEAKALLKAKKCPEGYRDIIIDGNHLALQVHESIGHPSELDRVLGYEAAYAGTSFLTPEKLNNLKVGSDIVNIVSDATIIGALGGFKYDDEGVLAKRIYIIKNGIFSGYLNSRETAAIFGFEPMGAMRAENWQKIPLIRMTSINLEPGNYELDDLIGEIDNGILLSTTKSWSIDDKRLNFQFATEIGWEVKGGKLGEMVKNPSYTGITPEFWSSCDGICNKNYWHVWGVPNCGKGEPPQIMRLSHGTSPARFRNVKVGVANVG
ncbi:MAG: TldD/PmbA family protein [Caldisericia bacterium]|nr:TldD/PmbA family protein [Caldisericia bacterium]MDD5689410.1 TldD/PmbA family protein [Caldisericia bacterium]HOJ16627.1 TldD/PmbA family protein [Caldisericia bacterium]HOW03416.1 TldD/PmbA family protein [Caldisericia bacterium]HPO29514.1 TldD/PmbA family protein [Caldisericia bacterium]